MLQVTDVMLQFGSNMPGKMASGESVKATLSYKVKKGQELFLRYDTYKVALGMTI